MACAYEVADWREYRMDWHDPHRILEPAAREIELAEGALSCLVDAGILPTASYDHGRFDAYREAVRRSFEIPWTAISPRLQRVMYAINAIIRPRVMVAVGIFCGNTFVCNAGAAIGPGSVYQAEHLVGLEIRLAEAERARRNVATLDPHGARVEIVGEDGIPWLRNYCGSIDLLYLDADGPQGRGKSIYLDLLEAGLHALHPGALVLAHNSVNSAHQLADYLAFVRNPQVFRESANLILDDQGLEVSLL